MRIAIDFNVARNEIVLVCENADSSCAESCINFIAPGMDAVTVHTEKGGETTQTVLTVSNGSACHVLDDTLMRTAGTFTIYAEDKQRLRFIVPENIPAGVEYTISLTDEGFRVKYVAPTGGGDHDCLVKSVNGQTGHVVIEIPEGSGLPDVTEADNGKMLVVVDGVWTVSTIPYTEVKNATGTTAVIG